MSNGPAEVWEKVREALRGAAARMEFDSPNCRELEECDAALAEMEKLSIQSGYVSYGVGLHDSHVAEFTRAEDTAVVPHREPDSALLTIRDEGA